MDDNPVTYTFLGRIRAFIRRSHFAVLAVTIASSVVIAYMIQFAPGAHWRWSGNNDDWARFGEYVGGLFGAFAFIGVLITIELQRKQLSQLAAQAAVDELHRICRDLASKIDDALDRQLIVDGSTTLALNARSLPATIRAVLEIAADADLAEDIGISIVQRLIREQYSPAINSNMAIVGPDLDLLAHCLEEAFVRTGSPVVMNYYRRRYRVVVQRMKVFGYDRESWGFWRANCRPTE